MFSRSKTVPIYLDTVITAHISKCEEMDAGSEEQQRHADTLKVLAETRRIVKESDKPWFQPSADQMIAAVASLAGIVSILTFEKWNVITSKSLSFVKKP